MADDFFTDFELIPDEALNLTPEEEASAFEAPDSSFTDAPDDALPFGRTVWMDWDRGELNPDQWVSGADAAVQVMQVALNVVRGTCPLLPDWFGVSGQSPLVGNVDTNEARVLHSTDARDTLLSAHERVTDVSGFAWERSDTGDVIGFNADVEIDGEVTTLVGGAILVD